MADNKRSYEDMTADDARLSDAYDRGYRDGRDEYLARDELRRVALVLGQDGRSDLSAEAIVARADVLLAFLRGA